MRESEAVHKESDVRRKVRRKQINRKKTERTKRYAGN